MTAMNLRTLLNNDQKNSPLWVGYFFCVLGFLINAYVYWPGLMTPDSQVQLKQALNFSFSSHHPPMMAFVWHYLMKVIPGQDGLFILHLSMLWTAAALFYRSFKIQSLPYAWLFILLPFLPTILCFSGFIWKDVGFAFSYLCCAALLSQPQPYARKKVVLYCIGGLVLLCYGTCLKYQAIFLAPLMALWMGRQLFLHDAKKMILTSVVIFSIIFGFREGFNHILVGEEKDNHSWQYVKLFDLAGMSVQKKEPIFPAYVLHDSDFSMGKIYEKYSSSQVDFLSFDAKAPLKAVHNDAQLNELWNFWFQSIKTYPFLYLKHRVSVLFKMINKTPQSIPIIKYNEPNIKIFKIISFIPKWTTQFIWTYLFSIVVLFTLCKGVKKNKTRNLETLFFLNLSTIIYSFVYLFFSMASDVRYVFVLTCFITFSLPYVLLANRVWKLAKT